MAHLPKPLIHRLQRLASTNTRTSRALKRVSGRLTTGPQQIANGPAKGMLIDVAGSRPSYILGTAEPEVQAFLTANLASGDVFYDLGANIGYFTLLAARLVGFDGQVRAYEPLPSNADALRRNIALNGLRNVTVIEAAVSSQTGQASFETGPTDQDGRLGEGTLTVATIALDDEPGPAPTVVKIDVEGAETDAIHGMTRLLAEYRPFVLCELHDEPLSFHHPAARALSEIGYRLAWLEGQPVAWAPHLVALPF